MPGNESSLDPRKRKRNLSAFSNSVSCFLALLFSSQVGSSLSISSLEGVIDKKVENHLLLFSFYLCLTILQRPLFTS